MSCNYIDNKIEIPEQITTDIINENNENSNGCDFNLKEFHESVSDGDKLNLENIIKKKFMKGNINNYGSNSNLNGINTILEDDDKESIAELFVADDDTIIIGGDLMEGLDKELDDFFEDLMKEG